LTGKCDAFFFVEGVVGEDAPTSAALGDSIRLENIFFDAGVFGGPMSPSCRSIVWTQLMFSAFYRSSDRQVRCRRNVLRQLMLIFVFFQEKRRTNFKNYQEFLGI
jgi:hypothetical protein